MNMGPHSRFFFKKKVTTQQRSNSVHGGAKSMYTARI